MGKEIFEKIYEKPGAVWTRTGIPRELIDLIGNEKIKPCRAIDIGCGEGLYSIYLAPKRFNVTGIDFSERAIQYAKENAKSRNVKVNFLVMDIADLDELSKSFDFALEWGILHHIVPSQRKTHVMNVSNALNSGGRYLSTSFNTQSPEFGSPGTKIRESPIGTTLYYSSQDELRELFSHFFRIIENKIITLIGREKDNKHIGNYLFMEKMGLP